MLYLEDPRSQGIGIVPVKNGHSLLKNDWPTIKLSSHQMNSDSSDLDSVLPCLILRVDTGKRRKEGGMNIKDGVRKSLNENWA